jgi:small-conductance mechanosensitive channel
MRPNPLYVIKVLFVLINLPAADNTVQLATGIGLALAGAGLAIP